MKKAIIFAKIPLVGNKEKLLEIQMNKLRVHAQMNRFEVIKEFNAFEDHDLGNSDTFLEILNTIEKQDSKIHVICYSEFNSTKSRIDDKFRCLLNQQKIKIENYSHPCFKEPDNNHVKIWRYLTLPKFIDLLQSSSLFFNRADSLRKCDNSESSYLTNASLNLINDVTNKKILLPNLEMSSLSFDEVAKGKLQINSYNEQYVIKENFVNCWHMNDFENFAMWRVYSEIYGVCIQSTYHNLYSCFNDNEWSFYDKLKKIYIGVVNYIDWNRDIIPSNNMFFPCLHKKKEFAYEQELRCVVTCKDKTYIKIKIDVDKLIQNIYINPYTPTWFANVFNNLCQQYNISKEKINQSSLT